MRTVPGLSTVVAEELRMTPSRLVQGRPFLMGLIAIALIVYLFQDSRLLPIWLGTLLPLNAWQSRTMGRATTWERPVRRRTSNLVRHLTTFGWMAIAIAIVALAQGFSGTSEESGLPAYARSAGVAGSSVLFFTIVSIVGQLINPRRKYLLSAVAMLVPLFVLPSRILLGFLPDFLHPVLIGPYGLDVFSGKWWNDPSTPIWLLNDWLIAAALWIPGCFAVLAAVASTHQE